MLYLMSTLGAICKPQLQHATLQEPARYVRERFSAVDGTGMAQHLDLADHHHICVLLHIHRGRPLTGD